MILAVACAALIVPLYWVAVRTAFGQRWDARLFVGSRDIAGSRVLRATGRMLDTISVESLALLGGAIVLIALLRGRARLAVLAAVLIAGANLTTKVMKSHLPRPALGTVTHDLGSFPSGHTTVAMSLAMALVLVAPPNLRRLAALAGGAYACAVGAAVIVIGWHRPSDVAGAYLVTTAWAAACAATARALGRRGAAPAPRALNPRITAAIAAVGIGLFCAGAAVAVLRHPGVGSLPGIEPSLVILSVLAVAVGAALMAVLTLLLTRPPAPGSARLAETRYPLAKRA